MALATNAHLVVNIEEALRLRTEVRGSRKRLRFVCGECNKPVKPHRAGGGGGAHFEHLRRNRGCSRSDVGARRSRGHGAEE